MSILQSFYPGDRAVEFLLIVGTGTLVLLATAWIVASRLKKMPATRHLVLSSAIGGSLVLPLFALAFSAAGLTLIAIPLLSEKSSATDSITSDLPLIPRAASGKPAAERRSNVLDRQAESATAPRRLGETPGAASTQPTTTVAVAPQRIAAPGASQRPRDLAALGQPRPMRAAATLLLIAWACGSGLLLLRLAQIGRAHV